MPASSIGAEIRRMVWIAWRQMLMAMSGVIGGGGLGKIALSYGYYRYQTDIMIVCVILLVLMVQVFQTLGTAWATRSDKRLRK